MVAAGYQARLADVLLNLLQEDNSEDEDTVGECCLERLLEEERGCCEVVRGREVVERWDLASDHSSSNPAIHKRVGEAVGQCFRGRVVQWSVTSCAQEWGRLRGAVPERRPWNPWDIQWVLGFCGLQLDGSGERGHSSKTKFIYSRAYGLGIKEGMCRQGIILSVQWR